MLGRRRCLLPQLILREPHYREPCTSPGVLLPVVKAFEQCCFEHPNGKNDIAAAISAVHVRLSHDNRLVSSVLG